MKKRVTVLRQPDNENEFIPAFDVWAYLQNTDGKNYTITVRYNPDITTANKLKYGNRYIAIEDIGIINEENDYMQITGYEIVYP